MSNHPFTKVMASNNENIAGSAKRFQRACRVTFPWKIYAQDILHIATLPRYATEGFPSPTAGYFWIMLNGRGRVD